MFRKEKNINARLDSLTGSHLEWLKEHKKTSTSDIVRDAINMAFTIEYQVEYANTR